MRYADDITTDTVTLVVSTTSQPAGALSGLIKLITPPKLGMYVHQYIVCKGVLNTCELKNIIT